MVQNKKKILFCSRSAEAEIRYDSNEDGQTDTNRMNFFFEFFFFISFLLSCFIKIIEK